MNAPAVFLDRDGTIFEDMHYPKDPNQVKLLPYAVEGLRLMRKKGYFLFVLSNQSGVARGIISDEAFKAVHKKCSDLLQSEGIEIDQFAYCLHHPDDPCSCRKPKPGLVEQIMAERDLNIAASFVIGDKLSDLELAKFLGSAAYLVRTGKGIQTENFLKKNDYQLKMKVFSHLFEVAMDLPELSR